MINFIIYNNIFWYRIINIKTLHYITYVSAFVLGALQTYKNCTKFSSIVLHHSYVEWEITLNSYIRWYCWDIRCTVLKIFFKHLLIILTENLGKKQKYLIEVLELLKQPLDPPEGNEGIKESQV